MNNRRPPRINVYFGLERTGLNAPELSDPRDFPRPQERLQDVGKPLRGPPSWLEYPDRRSGIRQAVNHDDRLGRLDSGDSHEGSAVPA